MQTQLPHQQQTKQDLPNASMVMVLGILSLVLCGLIGLVLSIIALVSAKKSLLLYDASPQSYTVSSVSNLRTGKTCATIGLVLSSVVLGILILYLLIYVLILGVIFTRLSSVVMTQ